MSPMSPRLLRPRARASGQFALLRQGLVAYWPLNEDAPSGDVTAVDWTGRGNDLTSNNTVASITGKINNAREFIRSQSEYLSRASNADLQFGDGNWSVSFWMFVTEANPPSGNTFMHVIGKDADGQRELGIRAVVGTVHRVQIDIYHTDNTLVQVLQTFANYNAFANQWQHFVITHNNGTIQWYVNGAAGTSGSRAAGKAFAANAAAFNIGRRSFVDFFEYYGGYVDEVAKWNRALSATEVSELYNGGNGIDLRQ